VDIVNSIALFHFLRPWWFVALPLWAMLAYALCKHRQQQNSWASVCDPALLGYLTGDAEPNKKSSNGCFLSLLLAGLLTITALAGPVWKQMPQPVVQASSAMILILDLSRSMDAQDIKPSRLLRAKQKIQDILAARTEGQTGLIVFAGSAFDVVPLSTDNKAILALLGALDTSMMPSQGSMASLALERAKAMFQRGAIQAGSVIMLCDGVDDGALSAAQALAEIGHRVSILAVGTADGAPIPLPVQSNHTTPSNGGFMKDSQGNIILPRLDERRLAAVATAGNGLFQHIQLDDADVLRLPGLIPSHLAHSSTPQGNLAQSMQSDQWYEQGPWLLLLVIPLCALAFRRGALLLWLLIPLLAPVALPSAAHATAWNDLWQNADQQAQSLMQHGKHKQAAARFEDPQWRAAALYRAGEFAAAAKALKAINTADALYNKGNALARAGRLQDAVTAYEQALKDDGSHEDAQFNRDLVKKALQKKKQQEKKKGKKQNKSDPKASHKQGEQSGKMTAQKNKTPEQANADTKTSQVEKSDQHASTARKADHANDKKAKSQQSIEQQRAQQQMLRRIPDDPGGLLRRKFQYQYQNQQQQSESQQPW